MRWKLRKILVKLFKLNNTPYEIALGVAIGVFIAIMPLYGLHTIMVIVAALLVRRSNKIAMFLGTNISLPPTVPFITWTGYEIGRFIFSNKYPALGWDVFKDLSFKKLAKLAQYYPPLFVGSLFLGIFLATIFYFITYFVVQRIINRRHARRARHHAHKRIRHP